MVELRKKHWSGRQRGADSAEISTPCITWGSTTADWGNHPRTPGNSSTVGQCHEAAAFLSWALSTQSADNTRFKVCLFVGLLRVVKQQVNIPVHVMIRPRAGDFHYSDQEMDVMRTDIRVLKENGADGFVLGLLHRLMPSCDVFCRRQICEVCCLSCDLIACILTWCHEVSKWRH